MIYLVVIFKVVCVSGLIGWFGKKYGFCVLEYVCLFNVYFFFVEYSIYVISESYFCFKYNLSGLGGDFVYSVFRGKYVF